MKRITIISLLLLISFFVHGQKERKYIREGNKAFEKENFQNAEVAYSKALKEPTLQHDASFNIGDALYKQEKYPEALNQFSSLEDIAKKPEQKANVYHNMGNTLLKQKKYKESIEAYKQALRIVPSDMDTKYNLAYAQKMLENEQNQENKQNQNKDQEQQKNEKNEKNQENQQDKKDQQNKKPNQDKKDNQQQQPQQQQLSKEDAERLLKAIANDEKKIQEKVKEKQAKAKHKKTTKEW